MAIKLGINGFGRIGRNVLRAAVQNFSDIEIVGINDLLEPEYLKYMLQYDSVHGRFKGEVSVEGNTLIVNGKKIRLTQERDPANLKWNDIGADIVLEATGLFLDKASGEKHLAAGAKKVIFSAPSKDDTPMFVYGVNDKTYAGQAIISNASCTTNCLAPVAKAIDDAFGIEQGLMTTIHSYTLDQKLLDGAHNDLRRARAAAAQVGRAGADLHRGGQRRAGERPAVFHCARHPIQHRPASGDIRQRLAQRGAGTAARHPRAHRERCSSTMRRS